MGLAELRAFLHVVDEGSFAAAATSLDVSRTTLRRHVDALEAETGVQLLERNSKGVVLTEAGQRLLRAGRVMEQEFSTMLRALRETTERPEGDVHVTMPTGLMPSALSVVVGLIRGNWPGVRIRASFVDDPHLVKASETDLLVWFGEASPLGSWETRTVGVARQRLLASADYLRSHPAPTTLAELEAHTMHAWLGPNEVEPMLFGSRGERLPLRATLITKNPHVLHECAHLNLGIAWVPDGDLGSAPGRPPLVRLLDDLAGRDVPLRLGAPRALAEVPKIRVFLERIAEMSAFVRAQNQTR